MAVPAGALNYVKPTTTVFELEALEGLPCGCVAAAYRARPWDVAVVSLEAKGPTAFSTATPTVRSCAWAIHRSSTTRRPTSKPRPGSPFDPPSHFFRN